MCGLFERFWLLLRMLTLGGLSLMRCVRQSRAVAAFVAVSEIVGIAYRSGGRVGDGFALSPPLFPRSSALTSWGAIMSGHPAHGLWRAQHLTWPTGDTGVFQALKHFLPDLRDHHVLVRTGNTVVVSYINHQGGLQLRPLYKLAYQILSLGAVYIPGHLNVGAYILIWSRSGECLARHRWTASLLGRQRNVPSGTF